MKSSIDLLPARAGASRLACNSRGVTLACRGFLIGWGGILDGATARALSFVLSDADGRLLATPRLRFGAILAKIAIGHARASGYGFRFLDKLLRVHHGTFRPGRFEGLCHLNIWDRISAILHPHY